MVGDSAYISQAWRGVAGQVTVTSRLRTNATLYAPAPPRTGRRGRPRKWGDRLPALGEIATSPDINWAGHTVRRYGKDETLQLADIGCLWEPLGPDTPVRVILVKDTNRPCGYQIALITTDLQASAARIVERYADRWPIEVAFLEGKELFGIGDARNRTQLAVERTVPFQFLAMDLTIAWYAIYGHHPNTVTEHRARAPWYLTKSTPSFTDMLAKLRRTIIASQFRGLLSFPWVFHRPGSGGQSPPCLSIASAIIASALWNPNARLTRIRVNRAYAVLCVKPGNRGAASAGGA